MTPEAAAAAMAPGDVMVVFKCGHWEKNPAARSGKSTGKICRQCGKYRPQEYVCLRCRDCGAVVRAKRSTRQLCAACSAAKQQYNSWKQARSYSALDTDEKFRSGPGDTMEQVAAALGVSKQRVQQIEARAERSVKNRWRLSSEKPGPVWEGWIYLDGALAFGDRSVMGADLCDAGAELLLEYWAELHRRGAEKPDTDRLDMIIFPVTDVFAGAS
jgi:hypothetical protein